MLRQEVLNHHFHVLPEGKTIETITPEEGVSAYKKAVDIRNQMGGAMYWNMLNDECHMLYDVCRHIGVEEDIMRELCNDLR